MSAVRTSRFSENGRRCALTFSPFSVYLSRVVDALRHGRVRHHVPEQRQTAPAAVALNHPVLKGHNGQKIRPDLLVMNNWWRRRESNPRPKKLSLGSLHA